MQKREIFWWVLAGILGLILVALIVGYISYSRMVVKPNKPQTESLLLPTATPTPDPLAPYSILLLGYGGAGHEGGFLTDSIMVAKIRPRDEEIDLISVPRDLWVKIPLNDEESINKKINEVFYIGMDDKRYSNKKVEFTGRAGGGELAKKVIGEVLGFKIDYFASIDFDGFIKIIDNLGGIKIKVSKTFDDPKYPIEANINDTCGKTDEEVTVLTATMSGEKLEDQFPCRYENLHFDRGWQHMDGTTALKFARSRHSPTDGGDFNRAERQKLVANAVKDRVINIGFISKIVPTVKILSRHIMTDIDFTTMNELVIRLPQLSEYKIISLTLTDKNVLTHGVATTGQFILQPKLGENNWEEVHKFIENKGIATSSAIIEGQN
ncbi:MAG TPA: LCP family protein [Candidatus Woesebacteria bacterium]|jgi:LCP family protein required for cell wall assembly|nr:LCP family protein [Candidatus Shapirobacteria bacterium]HOR02095.1 LCP family protein [Candidatus Woesebacteria bacterium]